ncbi:unnamed protein product [Meloidogyne enterolobii]|uniref:Uncharacterized protein n=1 Tax=Meloidogyne enterolobii TaxID=390850 RepID=A0ACB0ZG37_MELEN
MKHISPKIQLTILNRPTISTTNSPSKKLKMPKINLIKYLINLIFLILLIPSSHQNFINFEKNNKFSLNSRWRRSIEIEGSEDVLNLSEQKINNFEENAQQKRVAVGSRKRPEIFQAPTDRISVVRSQFRLKLSRYSNPARRMQNLTTCACPQQDPSNCGRDIGGNRSPCYFSFVIVASSSDQTVNFRSTPFVVIGDTGVIEASLEPEWGSELQLDFSTKPRFVDIYAYNLGPVFSLLDGRIISWSETLWPVDAWSLDLTNVLPHSFYEAGPFYEQRELFGRYDTNSALNLEFSVKCIGDSMGPECDLNCKRREGDSEMKTNQIEKPNDLYKNVGQPGWTICESEQRRYFACRFHDANRLQVDNCRFCEYGVINETICVHDPVQWKQEPENVFYKSWTILLGVLLIVTLILLILTCFLCWILLLRRFSSKSKRESALAGTYRRGGVPYSISGNDFGAASRLGDSLMLHKPLLLGNGIKTKLTKQQQQQFPIMGARSPSASQHWMAAAVGSVGEMGGSGPIITHTQNSPDTSESDYRPSPFTTPRREALV